MSRPHPTRRRTRQSSRGRHGHAPRAGRLIPRRERARGQTTLDFLIGISVFLVTVGVVLTFVPGILNPFVGGRTVNALTADRAATTLATGDLAGPEPYVLNRSGVNSFFDPATDVHDRLGLSGTVQVNVTLTNANQRWTSGPTPPTDAGSVISAWRVVSVDGHRSDLRVRVW